MGLDLVSLIKAAGYIGIFVILFAETGLFIGFFLPGDSLLFTAGLLASQGYLNPALLFIISFAAAVLGNMVGYKIGQKLGPAIFKKDNSLFFNKKHIERTQQFFGKHGGKALVLARFIPIVRTFSPVMAGVGNMNSRIFALYNFLGAFLWILLIEVLGFFLGQRIPDIDHYLLPIIALIIFISILPTLIYGVKEWLTSRNS